MPFGPTNMKAVKRILVALATVVVAAECFVPFAKREEVPVAPPYHPQSPCRNAFITCLAPAEQNTLFQHDHFDYRTLITHIDEVCQIYDEVASCLRPHVDECEVEDLRSQLEPDLSVGEFLCSVRGRSSIDNAKEDREKMLKKMAGSEGKVLREVQHTVCYTDPTRLFEVQIASQYCVAETAESERGGQNLCQQLGVAQRCLVQAATQECGKAAGEIITEYFNIVISALHENHCSYDGPHKYLKRGLDWLRK